MTYKTILFITLCFILLSTIVNAQWNNVSLNPPSNIFSLAQFENIIYAGGDSVLYFSTDGGNNWDRSSKIENVEYGISSIQKWNNKLFVGTYGYGIHETTDNGLSWITRNNGLNNSGAMEISALALRGDSLYAATVGEGVFVLNLINSTEWVPFRDGLPFGISWNVSSLYNFNGTLICGAGGNACVYLNYPNSTLWIEKSFDMPAAEPNAMIALTSYADTLVGIAQYGIYISRNNGDLWDYYNPGIGLINSGSVISINNVIIALISKLARSYLLSSTDGGNTWQYDFEFNQGGFAVSYFNNRLFTGRSNGLYWMYYNPSDIDDEIITNTFRLFQNYPNPFNPTTKIKFSVPDVGTGLALSVLKVYDILGNEIVTLVNEYKTAGSYEIEFSGAGLSSGIYFYRFIAGKFTETKKMILLR